MKKQTWVLVLAAVAIALVNTALFSVYLAPDGNETLTTLFDVSLFAGLALLFVLAIIALVLHNSSARCNPVRERQVMLIIKLGLVPFYLFIVMQFFFVLDVVAALVMFFLGRSREKAAEAGA